MDLFVLLVEFTFPYAGHGLVPPQETRIDEINPKANTIVKNRCIMI